MLFEHVLFMCSKTFQVFRAGEHVLFTCFETLWSAKRPTLKFMIWEREIDGEWPFNTLMSSRSSSCNFSDVRPL